MSPSMLLNFETFSAVLGAGAALFIPLLLNSSGTGGRAPAARSKLPAGCWVCLLLLSLLSGMSVHAAKQAAQGPFSVQLHRQLIPLHSNDGVLVHKSAYHGQISVGGPQSQQFDVVFDTGSGHLVLPSTMCHSDTCKKHRRYRKKASLMATDIDFDGTPVQPGQARDQITVSFGTGEVTGVFVEDYVCLGTPEEPDPLAPSAAMLVQLAQKRLAEKLPGSASEDDDERQQPLSKKELAAAALAAARVEAKANRPKNQRGCVDLRIIAATEMSEDPFASFNFDGVLGLGLQGLAQTPEFHFVEMASAAGAWGDAHGADQTFGVFLAHSDDEQSEITFGGWQPDRFVAVGGDDGLAWVPIRDPEQGYWQVDVIALRANGVDTGFCNDGCRAVVDTGTSLLGVPSAVAPLLSQHLTHTAEQGADCSGPGPELEIVLNNFTVRLTPADYARPDTSRQATGVVTTGDSKSTASGVSCVPMLMFIDLPPPLGPKLLILGEPVLQKYYAAFHGGAVPRVGFAEAKHSRPREAPQAVVV